MKTSVPVLNGALALALCLSAGCASRRRVVIQDPGYTPPVAHPAPEPAAPTPPRPVLPETSAAKPPAAATGSAVVTEAPPPPHIEVVRSSPGPGYVWMPGCWEWKNGWSWVNGRWAAAPQPNAAWIPGRWVRRSAGGWIWVRGYWR